MKILNIVSCAVLNDGDVLLILRKKPPYAKWWALPGGKLEFGETLVEGTIREVKEETGIQLQSLNYHSILNEVYHVDGELTAHFVVHYFVSDYPKEQVAEEKEEGIVKWFPLSKLPENLVPSDLMILQRIRDKQPGVSLDAKMISTLKDGIEHLQLEWVKEL